MRSAVSLLRHNEKRDDSALSRWSNSRNAAPADDSNWASTTSQTRANPETNGPRDLKIDSAEDSLDMFVISKNFDASLLISCDASKGAVDGGRGPGSSVLDALLGANPKIIMRMGRTYE